MYEALGVDRSASKDEIKRVYKRMAMKHHPDKEGGDAERFKAISEAYAVLSDDENRTRYDAVGDQGWNNGAAPPGGAGQPMSHAEMMAHMFAGMAGMGQMPGMPGMQQASRARRRGDHVHVLKVSLREAFSGARKTLRIKVQMRCPACGTTKCGTCGGTGSRQQIHAMGMMRHVVTSTCPSCGGAGATRQRCDTCSNTGQRSVEHVLSVDVPVGVQTGHRECVKGLGEQSMDVDGDSPGDLYVEVSVAEDPVFTRHGDDLQMVVGISLWDSIVGKTFTVQTLGDKTEQPLTIDTRSMGTGVMQAGRRYLLAGHGMPLSSGPKGSRGGLAVTFVISYPSSRLSVEQHAGLSAAISSLGLT